MTPHPSSAAANFVQQQQKTPSRVVACLCSLHNVKEQGNAAQRPVNDVALRAHLGREDFLPKAGLGRVYWTLIRVPRLCFVHWDRPHLEACSAARQSAGFCTAPQPVDDHSLAFCAHHKCSPA